jgi:hypothetical protein
VDDDTRRRVLIGSAALAAIVVAPLLVNRCANATELSEADTCGEFVRASDGAQRAFARKWLRGMRNQDGAGEATEDQEAEYRTAIRDDCRGLVGSQLGTVATDTYVAGRDYLGS